MFNNNFSTKVNHLFEREEWDAARKLLEKEQKKAPDSHWVITQLGVTYYEQRRYTEALPFYMASLKIMPDCPLTLWNLAGTLDALGRPAEAIPIYTWLLENKTSPAADPCWESDEWKAALQADCMFSLGVCFQKLNKKKIAQHWYRQYLNMLLLGVDGTYAFSDVVGRMRSLRGEGRQCGSKRELRKAVDTALQFSGTTLIKNGQHKLPKLNVQELLATLPATRSG